MKELLLQCPRSLVDTLCQAINDYAPAAYPPGGSECAQAAREALLNAAQMLAANYDPQLGTTKMSRRIRTHVIAAVDYHFADSDTVQQKRKQQLLSVLAGRRVTQEEWES